LINVPPEKAEEFEYCKVMRGHNTVEIKAAQK
jgi:hypothetical protein